MGVFLPVVVVVVVIILHLLLLWSHILLLHFLVECCVLAFVMLDSLVHGVLGEGPSVVDLAPSSPLESSEDAIWIVIVIDSWRSVILFGHGLIKLK